MKRTCEGDERLEYEQPTLAAHPDVAYPGSLRHTRCQACLNNPTGGSRRNLS